MLLSVPHYKQLKLRTLLSAEGMSNEFACKALGILGKLKHLKPFEYFMYHQFNIHKFYVLPTQLYLCVLCGHENKERLFPYTVLTDWFV
jgi:hypothetical protein